MKVSIRPIFLVAATLSIHRAAAGTYCHALAVDQKMQGDHSPMGEWFVSLNRSLGMSMVLGHMVVLPALIGYFLMMSHIQSVRNLGGIRFKVEDTTPIGATIRPIGVNRG
jgi:hypothetical protein